MRRAAVLIAAALLLAGCGGQAQNHAGPGTPPVTRLCVVAGIPTRGLGAAAGEALLSGLRAALPSGGVRIGSYRLQLCHVDHAGAAADALAASANVYTSVYVGGLTGNDAAVAGAILQRAGIAMLSPAPYRAAVAGASPNVAYLQPSISLLSQAVNRVKAEHHCARRRHGRPTCTVLTATPLCTGIAAADSTVPRYCVVAGPLLTNKTPAAAYGAAIGQLLTDALHSAVAGGADIAQRTAVVRALLGARLPTSLIGPVRFDRGGVIEADLFSVYTVEPDGSLVPSQTIRTH